MADFNFSDVASKVQGPQQMSLGEMLNIARGAQAYQQSQQVNPLQLEQEQLKTRLARETIEPSIAGEKAVSEKKVYEAQKAGVDLNNHYGNVARGVYGGHLTDPDFINGNTEAMIKKLDADKSYFDSIGIPSHDSKMHDQLVQLAKTNPAQAYQMISSGVNTAAGAQAQQTMISGSQNTPIYKGPGAPVGQTNIPAEQVEKGVTAPRMNAPVESQPVKLSYPVRVPGQPANLYPSEEADRTAGVTYRNTLQQQQNNLTAQRDNNDDVIRTARQLDKESWLPTSGVLGGIQRKVSTALGDTTYLDLNKELANSTISNMKALGLSTDADKQLLSAANGEYTYPPKILEKIGYKNKGFMTNIDMQTEASKKFSDKFGDANLNSFKQMWNKNADNKIFQVINLTQDPDLTKDQKKERTNELLGISKNMPAEQQKKIREKFNLKYQNLLKLTQDGTL